ncbi:GNAT family N-acetyltransferase [Peptacetobacter sp.]|uniref:GNAT family N-acetyltransferase n=1 Tax=Peptacetobacter sp. TaxID=2991975 RepID=UPI00260EEAFF|nr:GNAT family N-acetyltransferase [Peptacetobacter sp.]
MNCDLDNKSNFYFEKEVFLSCGKTLYIRNAIGSDAESVVNFFKIASDETENLSFSSEEFNIIPFQEKMVISTFNKSEKSIMLLGFIDDVLCCVAELFSPKEARLSHNAEYSITVLKKFWDIGIGNAITKNIINFAKSKNIKNITLSVRGENSAAINLYKKYDFNIIGIKKNYIQINEKYDDEILMQLQLD